MRLEKCIKILYRHIAILSLNISSFFITNFLNIDQCIISYTRINEEEEAEGFKHKVKGCG